MATSLNVHRINHRFPDEVVTIQETNELEQPVLVDPRDSLESLELGAACQSGFFRRQGIVVEGAKHAHKLHHADFLHRTTKETIVSDKDRGYNFIRPRNPLFEGGEHR